MFIPGFFLPLNCDPAGAADIDSSLERIEENEGKVVHAFEEINNSRYVVLAGMSAQPTSTFAVVKNNWTTFIGMPEVSEFATGA
jgi:hypothetical protein